MAEFVFSKLQVYSLLLHKQESTSLTLSLELFETFRTVSFSQLLWAATTCAAKHTRNREIIICLPV